MSRKATPPFPKRKRPAGRKPLLAFNMAGSVLTLQKILGHSSLAMTVRYAHLAPDHLQAAVRLGPLKSFLST